jgi:hypothetical protein
VAARWTAAGVSKLLAYYNSVEGIIREGGSNRALWDEVHGIEAEGGPVTEGATIFDMNEVAQRARAVLAAESNWQAGLGAGTVTGDMASWAPWATRTTAAFGQPDYQIRYQYEAIGPEGEASLVWGQTDWQGGLPDTQADILTRIEGSAQNSLDNYNVSGDSASSLGNITAVQLLRI